MALSFFDRIVGRRSSRNVARERLQLVLVHDRTSMAPEFLESVKEDILDTLSRRLDVDADNAEVDLEKDDESVALVANIPVKSLKGRQQEGAARGRRSGRR